MDIDELFKKTGRLKAPDSLRIKLMAELEMKTGLLEKLAACIPSSRPVWTLAAIAAMALFAIRVYPGPKIVTLNAQAERRAEAHAMLAETLGPVFYYDDEPDLLVEPNGERENASGFLKRQFDEIYWTNGGNGDA